MATSAAAGIGEVEMCKFCGDEPVARVCTAPACARKQLCVNCDEIWHGHPSRRSHQRQEVDALLRENGRSDQPLTQPQQQGYPWSCPHCTFQNVSAVQWKPEDRLMCEVCSKTSVGRELREAAPAQTSNSNTTKTKKSTKKSSPSTEIACPTCTFVNTAKGAKQCEMCNSQLPSPSKKRENPAAASPNAENSVGLSDLSPQERQRQFQAQAAIGRQNAGRSNQGDQQPPSQSNSESHRKQAHASAVEDRVEQKRQRTLPPSENRVAAVETLANSPRKETRTSSRSDVVPADIATESKQLEDAEYPLYQQLEEKELQVQLAELLAVEEAEKRQLTQVQLQEREQQIQELQTRLKEEQERRLRTERRFKKEATERQQLELAMLELQRLERENREELERQARIEDDKRRQREAEEMRQRKREEAERKKKEREEAERLRQQREEAERLRKEREETERLRKEREEAERLRKEKEEAERLRQQREEADRWRKEREEAERLRKETEEAQRLWEREEAERQRRNHSLRNASAAVGRWERAEEERLRQEQAAEAMQNDLQLIRKTRLQRGKQVPLDENPRIYQGDEARQRRADDTAWQMAAVTHASGLQFEAHASSFPSRAESSATVSARRVEDSEPVDAAEKLLNGIYGPENDIEKANTSDESDEFDEPKISSTRVTCRMKAQKAGTKPQCAHCGKYRAITGPIKPVGFQCFNCYKHTCKMCGRPWEDVHTGRKCKELDSLPEVAPSPKRGSVSRPGSAQIQFMRCTRCRVHVDTYLKRDSSNFMCRNCGNILHLPRPY
ncbi:hypothetical protein BOX15_Mlig012393g3 [Macrostomum lignano]|uniref:Uncharacterized protein n=1 Tax=Macrostomum lignano TaxID=282301 RepID=A0A267F0W2_9PLAT|nr:hypothetical protein BOX15_Mlig012393g3 [Macrostomum lignano]